RFAITDRTGETFELGPENFRFACGYAGSSAPPLEPALKLLSSHVTPEVVGDEVHFVDGRGWGHGVGMCQWGAQGLALRSYSAQDILAAYYPGAQIVRLY